MTIEPLTSIKFYPPNNHHYQSKQFYSQSNQFNLKEIHPSILHSSCTTRKPKMSTKPEKTPNSVHIIYYHHIFNNKSSKKKLHQNALVALHLTFHSMHLTLYHFSCDQFQSLKWFRKFFLFQ